MTDRHEQIEGYELANWLVGPFSHEPERQGILEPWQVPYYEVALGALRRTAGREQVPSSWAPDPAEGANLYREFAYERKLQGMITSLNAYIADYESDKIETPLRPNQREIFNGVAAQLMSRGAREQIDVKSPTGTGKTLVMLALIQALKYKEQPNDPVSVALLVPTKDIFGQTIDAHDTFTPDMELGRYFGEPNSKIIRPVTLWIYASFERARKAGIIRSNMFDVLIKDESHESEGKKIGGGLDVYSWDRVEGKNKVVIGMSATPTKEEDLAYKKTVVEAVDEGLISPISTRPVYTHATIKEKFRGMRREDFTEEELADLIENTDRNRKIVQEVLDGLASGRRVTVRCIPGASLLHAELINTKLNSIRTRIVQPYTGAESFRRVRSVIIDGSMSLSRRRLLTKIFNNHLRDDLDVIVFVDTLVQGWDSRVNKKTINGSPSRSWRVLEQLLGRLTRSFWRADGTQVHGEGVDIVDQSISGQLTFEDVINRDAPIGTRLRRGAIIGPGLRDLRMTDPAMFSAFEDIPEGQRKDYGGFYEGGSVLNEDDTGLENEEASTFATKRVVLGTTPSTVVPRGLEVPAHIGGDMLSLTEVASLLDVSQVDVLKATLKIHVTPNHYRDDSGQMRTCFSDDAVERLLDAQDRGEL